MTSPVADLEAGLQVMLSLKPPGVSGSRIQSITTLCTDNVQSESVLVQKLYTHFKKAPATHKLGVLYVVDSVTRKWAEQAKNAGQPINSSAQDGTYAAGVHRVKELLPVLMNDIVVSAPYDQKEKIKKLVDIWEKSQTFPLQMLSSFKERLSAPPQNDSTTPPGSPPVDLQSSLGLQQSGAAPPNTSSILAALANMARQNSAASAPALPSFPNGQSNLQPKDHAYSFPPGQSNGAQPATAMNHQSLPFPPIHPPVNVPAPSADFVQQSQGISGSLQNVASNPPNPFAAAQTVIQPNTLTPALQQQLLLAKALSDQGIPQDKILGIITAMGSQGASGLPPQLSQFSAQSQNSDAQNSWARPEESHDRNAMGFHEPVRSPQDRYRRRSRSPSPARGWGARDSPASHRRDVSMYDYERDSPGRNRGDDRGRGRAGRGNDYRQRSPQRRSLTPPRPGGAKWVGHDESIGKGNIKVLSRTLFVGGVTMSEPELRREFVQHGHVQTCIVNKEKRHAFVKMVSRADAVAAKEAMEKPRDSQIRTRWGVGFGPRDCSDYQTGISIIPISKLTDADRKWMLSAEYGGSGGTPIEPGMVVEEPDIEIGQGVSSKAISRRMQTDKGGNNGPKSSRDKQNQEDENYRHNRHDNKDSRRDHDRDNGRNGRGSAVSGPPSMPSIPPFSMPGFPPFSMPSLPNGMPMMPPGFMFPGAPNQPPPPGTRKD